MGHISAFSKEDSVHYYTPGECHTSHSHVSSHVSRVTRAGGMALRYCYKFGVKWNNTGWLGTKEPLIEGHYLEIPDVSYYCQDVD